MINNVNLKSSSLYVFCTFFYNKVVFLTKVNRSPTSGQLRLLIQGCLLEIQDLNSVLNSGNTKIWENFQDKACHGVCGPSEVKVTKSYLTLCNPIDYTVHGILQARILEWVAYPLPENLPNPGIEPGSPALWVILYQLSYQGSLMDPSPFLQKQKLSSSFLSRTRCITFHTHLSLFNYNPLYNSISFITFFLPMLKEFCTHTYSRL